VVATGDATFAAPANESQNVRAVVACLDEKGRPETKVTPSDRSVPVPGAWAARARHWLFGEALPLWSTAGVDRRHGGFHEALSLDGVPLPIPKRLRTMARQVYAFSAARIHGWDGPADRLIGHGLEFIVGKGRNARGGFARTFNPDGSVLDTTEDAYDHAFVLLALAHAHAAGNADAAGLADEAFRFLDTHLADSRAGGFLDTAGGGGTRRSNPHMHLLEAFLAWHEITGEAHHLERAAAIVELFRARFFDTENWALGEYFDDVWRSAEGERGRWTEPGHHFEWASLLGDFARRSGRPEILPYARKLYASALAMGINRATGLAFAAVSRDGAPLDTLSRSWPQTEAIKAAIALSGTGGPDLGPEIEARVGRLFHWHVDPAPSGMWIDRIDAIGRARATEVPASILYHMVSALTRYLDHVSDADQKGLTTFPVST
jgi:mannose/cellobiose epimerase-like protein (N-acyl-D-glucosamine 2-epimerase family)